MVWQNLRCGPKCWVHKFWGAGSWNVDSRVWEANIWFIFRGRCLALSRQLVRIRACRQVASWCNSQVTCTWKFLAKQDVGGQKSWSQCQEDSNLTATQPMSNWGRDLCARESTACYKPSSTQSYKIINKVSLSLCFWSLSPSFDWMSEAVSLKAV